MPQRGLHRRAMLAALGGGGLAALARPGLALAIDAFAARAPVGVLDATLTTAQITGPETVVSAPRIAAQATPYTADLAADGYTWAQGHPLIVDRHHRLIALAQQHRAGSPSHSFVVSNDDGASWTDLGAIDTGFLERGSMAYDAIHDALHVLWVASNPTDGVIYRRYRLARDGDGRLTGFARDHGGGTINLQLDAQVDGFVSYVHPVLLWLDDPAFEPHGALLALWGVAQAGTSSNGFEIRASMRVLADTAEDGLASAWRAPATNDASTIATGARVACTVIRAGADAAAPWPAVNRKLYGTNALDVYVTYAVRLDSVWSWRFRRLRWRADQADWSAGLSAETMISNLVRSGADRGYAYKYQLGSEPREDVGGDRMIVGLATWSDDQRGDSWSLAYLNRDDTVSGPADVYTPGAAQCSPDRFVTGDVVYDACLNRAVASYTTLPEKHCYLKAYDGTTEQQGAVAVFTGAPVDIPTLWQAGAACRYVRTGVDHLLVLFRDFNTGAAARPPASPVYSPPYTGYFGTLTWARPAGDPPASDGGLGGPGRRTTDLVSDRPFAHPAFFRRWAASDRAAAGRTYVYGPAPFTSALQEPYLDAPCGHRLVQYFDKARMELTDPATGVVTAGLLAVELITGRQQDGDRLTLQRLPARLPVAGDPDTPFPHYADLAPLVARVTDRRGRSAIQVYRPGGHFETDPAAAADPLAVLTDFDEATGHNLPRAFADFRADPTFGGVLTIGLAITEPIWAEVRVGGQPRRVLMQAFERRVLTYTPDNPAGFRVEYGNIGRHYHAWRYQP